MPQYDWELKVAKINEGGCFVEQNGKLYLAFSANGGDTKSYCVGLIEFTGDYKKDDLNNKSKDVYKRQASDSMLRKPFPK